MKTLMLMTPTTTCNNDDDDDDDAMLLLLDINAKFVFNAPPSIGVLWKRLMNRGMETRETIDRRMRNALAEINYGKELGAFDAIVVNDDLDDACAEFERVVEVLYLGG